MIPAAVSNVFGGATLFVLFAAASPTKDHVRFANDSESRGGLIDRSARSTASRIVLGTAGGTLLIEGPTVWRSESTYELAGPVIVAAGGTLTIQAGTRVEARPGASLNITRDGRLIADGTQLQPVVLSCTSVPKYDGCWEGLTLRGFARLNYGQPVSPAARSTAAAGCLQSGTGDGAFGGCDDADSSGVLQYLRVEHASRGIELLGVGSGTRIDYVQVNRSRSDGIAIVGGAVDLRHAFLTANAGYGLSWRAGWRGRGQFISVQQDAARNTGGMLGSNVGPSQTVLVATPRSAPTLFNVTIVAPSSAANPFDFQIPSAIHLIAGTGGVLRNVLVYGASTGLDVDDNYTCLDFFSSPPVSLANVVIAGTTRVGSPDDDSLLCGSYASPNVEAEWLADPANASVTITDPTVVAAMVRNGTDLKLPDLRPSYSVVPVSIPTATPPTDGFFDVAATYAGALPSTSASRNDIPWYSGWTVPAPLPPIAGAAAGVVASSVTGPFAGAVVSASFGASDTTSTSGAFSLALPPGQHVLTTTSLPIACSAPPVNVTVVSGATATANINVACTTVNALAAGAAHACAQTGDDRLQCWGQNDYGMVGDGTINSPRLLPVLSGDNLTFVAGSLTSGYTHSCALRAGAALCWGLNFFGALGLGSTGLVATTPVPAGNTGTPLFVAVSAGGYHSCALIGTGEAWCWGWNQEGQVGIASSGPVVTPTAVNGGTLRFTKIAAGESHTCALTAVGTAYCWGGNGRGELGSDPAVVGSSSAVPVAVPGGLSFASIDAGTLHTCGITTAGEAYCWGSRDYGQLGDGSVTGMSNGPVAVSTTERFSQLSAGAYTTCAVTTTQQLRCWGAGASGALGDGTQVTRRALPAPVSGSLSANAVTVNLSETGAAFACAVTPIGEAFCWGAGATGQLGTGQAVTSSTVPVQVRIRGP